MYNNNVVHMGRPKQQLLAREAEAQAKAEDASLTTHNGGRKTGDD
jgi:hypothetical protein